MKVIKPEINELNEKFKNDAVKRQQETMKLYNKAGANPLLGCVPALLQLPVFYALFCFFPIAFQLRGNFFYTKMSSGAQMQTTQPGMPNMKFIMYLMPVMMLFFFNNYASAFSQVQENKKKPRKQNRFQRKMQEMMEEAERQRKLQGKK